jgi:hypothetical protein
LKVPESITVWKEDLSSGYAMLSVMRKMALKSEIEDL